MAEVSFGTCVVFCAMCTVFIITVCVLILNHEKEPRQGKARSRWWWWWWWCMSWKHSLRFRLWKNSYSRSWWHWKASILSPGNFWTKADLATSRGPPMSYTVGRRNCWTMTTSLLPSSTRPTWPSRLLTSRSWVCRKWSENWRSTTVTMCPVIMVRVVAVCSL